MARRSTKILAPRNTRRPPMHATCPKCGERASIVSRVDLRNGTNRVLDRRGTYECVDCGRLWDSSEVIADEGDSAIVG